MNNNDKMAKLAVNKSLLKEYQTKESSRAVYMKDGDEFQIQLFNSQTSVIAAEIYINNIKISDSLLVIYPGQMVWLERYIDEAKKFRFSTYEVEDNHEAVNKAIADNGNITIKFYKEKSYRQNVITIGNRNVDDNWWNDIKTQSFGPTVDCSHYNDLLSSSAYDSISSVCTSATSRSIDGCCSSAKLSVSTAEPKMKETGRVESGSYSSQSFDSIDKDFETFAFHTEMLKILPVSQKTINVNDLQKIYCTECGRKLNSKFKFCPYCGTEVYK